MRGDKDFGNASRLDKVQVIRYFHQQSLVGEDVFCLRSATCQAHDSLSRLPHAYLRPDGIDFAGKFETGDL